MIRHTVVFSLKHAAHSAEENLFMNAADFLATIPGVQKFEKMRQTMIIILASLWNFLTSGPINITMITRCMWPLCVIDGSQKFQNLWKLIISPIEFNFLNTSSRR